MQSIRYPDNLKSHLAIAFQLITFKRYLPHNSPYISPIK